MYNDKEGNTFIQVLFLGIDSNCYSIGIGKGRLNASRNFFLHVCIRCVFYLFSQTLVIILICEWKYRRGFSCSIFLLCCDILIESFCIIYYNQTELFFIFITFFLYLYFDVIY